MNPGSLVSLAGVAKHVELPDDTRLDILTAIDLDIEPGDHVAIVGRSGSGKSTLLNILGMLDTPSAGTVSFGGKEVRKMGSGARDRMRGRSVGFVFQQFNLLPGRTARENVAMPLGYSTGRDFWRRARLAEEMLERVGLGHRLDSPPERLSGGEQQRVAIARALVRRPALILADEPTGALDVDTGAAVMSLLDEIATETDAALVTITHDLHVAARARRHYRLEHGVLSPVDLDLAHRETALGAVTAAESALALVDTTPEMTDAAAEAIAEAEAGATDVESVTDADAEATDVETMTDADADATDVETMTDAEAEASVAVGVIAEDAS